MFTKIELQVIREALSNYRSNHEDSISQTEYIRRMKKSSAVEDLILRFTALCEDYK